MTSVSVVIPVKDGERYLAELLEALLREEPDEVLVIDSGSRDSSLRIASAAGIPVLEIPPEQFAHGPTRNLGVERTRGELICFLTQDATPCPGWLAAYREAFTLSDRIGAAYGPHLPRPQSSPMIARELEEFFQSFSPDGRPVVQGPGDPSFLSNANACYARACWEEIRFRELPYAEDQAFGTDLLAAGWQKVYHPDAAVLHAHDYGWGEFMRRYFDEYRGLRATIGHVEPFSPLTAARLVGASVAADARWLRQNGVDGPALGRWVARSAAHHGGRRVFSAAGSRAGHLPRPLRRRLSLESSDHAAAPASMPEISQLPARRHVPALQRQADYELPMRILRKGGVPLLTPPAGIAERESLRLAMVIPPFDRGSGGHNTLFQIFSRLEERGHIGSVWMHDYFHHYRTRAAANREHIRKWFAPIKAPVYEGFGAWHGADVVIATGWQTAHPVLSLPSAYAQVYIVNDHEPDFYAASTEQVLAADTYRHGLHCAAASPWLRDLLVDRYGASADTFQLGVDHHVYHPRPVGRRRDTVVYYARHSTPRRAVPIGLMALGELHQRRPEVRIILFGTSDPVPTTFPYEQAGILNGEELAALYSMATVGLCLSLTNFSLMPKEMLACGLPCVELAGISAESIFGEDGPLELAPLNAGAIADAIEWLLDDEGRWERRSRAGMDFVASHTWAHATDEVESAIRHALALREASAAAPDTEQGLPADQLQPVQGGSTERPEPPGG